MKLHYFLLTALLLVSTTVFADKSTAPGQNKNKDKDKNKDTAAAVEPVSYQDFASMTITDESKTLTVLAFEFNGSGKWQYYLYGNPTAADALPFQLELSPSSAQNSGFGTVIAEKVKEVAAAIPGLDIPEGVDVSKAHAIYQFTIPFNDSDISAFGLSGSNGSENQTAYASISGLSTVYESTPAGNGMGIAPVQNVDNAIVHAKPQWAFNNGALFLVSVTSNDTNPVGTPLPAPVVTLLIALGFGAALVMYRNRKQVKA